MMDFTAIIKTVAPWIGTALGTPLAGMAIAAAANALGASDKTVDGIKTALAGATPEQMLALKTADQVFETHMVELGFKNVETLEALAVQDRASARNMQIAAHSIVPALLTWLVVSAFMSTLTALFFREVPQANRDIVVYMVGQLSGFTAASIAFWLGTTRDSARKTEIIAKSEPPKGNTP